MKLPDFEAWAIFATVAEHRSFSAAADALGVSKATVSKAITRLEASLGTSLFHRTSRRLTLTESGITLSDHAQRILAEGHAAEETAHDAASAPAGMIRVAAPMTFGIAYVAPAIADFMTAHPAVQIDLRLSDAKVDIVADGIDLALRIADLPDSSLRARRLAPVETRVVAAPAYLERHGRPRHPLDLGEHDIFAYANVPSTTWTFRGPDGAEVAVRPNGRFTTDSGDAMLPLLHAGLGIARLPDFIVDTEIAAGRLEAILTEWTGPATALHLVTPPSPLRPVRVELLIDFLAERFRQLCASRA
ncbi:LysR family transcriptional regulator [Sphingomonas panacisoli]|uniref:LysR family transcriptional regulator n=1 Tax=Sphingomonas panacisoli TaxID=1813879 RepID=A0A5B8LFB1_9SPHN|nr:LysR family transcriptional regulator [Sphingomonas panacisoli]QDZ06771.1 LysR family transcriptional regulator [Sphingomonas panacisoli]